MRPIEFDEEGVLLFIKNNPGTNTVKMGIAFNLTTRNMNALMKRMVKREQVILQFTGGTNCYFDAEYAKKNIILTNDIEQSKPKESIFGPSVLKDMLWLNEYWPARSRSLPRSC